MSKKLPFESALHDWVRGLSFQMQALLMTGMRGPDTLPKECAGKELVRYLRYAICKPADHCKAANDNAFMWGAYSLFVHSQRWFFDDPDGYPHHFTMHLVHCAEVIGYYHPDDFIRQCWNEFYCRACDSFHMHPEKKDQMDRRLNDFEK